MKRIVLVCMLTTPLIKGMSYEEANSLPPKKPKLKIQWRTPKHCFFCSDYTLYQGNAYDAADEKRELKSSITIAIEKPTIIDQCRGINPKEAEILHLVSNEKYATEMVRGAIEKIEAIPHIERIVADVDDVTTDGHQEESILKRIYVQLGFHQKYEPVEEIPTTASQLFAQLSSMVCKKLGWERPTPIKRLVYVLERDHHHEKED